MGNFASGSFSSRLKRWWRAHGAPPVPARSEAETSIVDEFKAAELEAYRRLLSGRGLRDALTPLLENLLEAVGPTALVAARIAEGRARALSLIGEAGRFDRARLERRLNPAGGGVNPTARAALLKTEIIHMSPVHVDFAGEGLPFPAGTMVSAWAIPVLARSGEVAGTLTVYWPERRTPTPGELDALRKGAALAGFLIEKKTEMTRLEKATVSGPGILDQNEIGAALVAGDGEVLRSNEMFARVSGRRPEEIAGRPLWLVLEDEETSSSLQDRFERMKAASLPQYLECRVVRLDGVETWTRWTLAPLRREDGDRGEHLLLAEDVTEAKRVQHRLETALAAAGAGEWDYEVGRNLFRFSRRFRDLIGQGTPGEEGFHEFLARVHEEDRPGFQARFRSAVVGRGPVDLEFRLRSGGGVRWFAMLGSVRTGGRGTAEEVSGALMNISVAKEAEDALLNQGRWLQSVLDRMPMPLLLLEPRSARILFANSAAQSLADAMVPVPGLKPGDESPSVYCTDGQGRVLGEEEMPGVRAARGETLRGFEVVWHTPKGEIPYLVYSERLPAAFGQEEAVVLVFNDVSSLKRIEAELRRAKEDAEKANEAKSQFLANMSHEIRTPLGAVLGFTQLLQEPSLPPHERERYVEIVNRNGELLSRVISDILDLSRVEAGQISIENECIDFRDLVRDTVEALGVQARRKGLRLHLSIRPDVPGWVRSDSSRIRQIYGNIIGNAIKFTERGHVEVDVGGEPSGQPGRARVRMIVKDTGIGIPREKRDQLFRTFSQGDGSMTRRFGGTGLGLVLARKLARMLGGDVRLLDSAPGEGAAFEITLDLESLESRSASPVEAVGEVPASPLQGARVLLVEDSRDNQVLIQRLLAKKGIDVELADDGGEGVAKALARDFDLVLMDIQMPVLDGYDAARSLRQQGFKKPMVALTAHAMKEDMEKSRQAGFDAHLTKPVDPRALFQTVGRFYPGSSRLH